MLTQTDIEKIDRAAIELLADPGIKVEDEEIATKLFRLGAKPGNGTGVVRFPREMVKEYLSLAPEKFLIADRAGRKREISPGGESCFWTGAALSYLDSD